MNELDTLIQAAKAALDEWDRNTCVHESTHRGGFLWTICDDCGMKWADDRGGFKPYSDPPGIANLRAAVSAMKESENVKIETELLRRLPEVDDLLEYARIAINRGTDLGGALPYIGKARNLLGQMYGELRAAPAAEPLETTQPKVVQFSEGNDWFTVLLSDGRMFRASAGGTRWVPIQLDTYDPT